METSVFAAPFENEEMASLYMIEESDVCEEMLCHVLGCA